MVSPCGGRGRLRGLPGMSQHGHLRTETLEGPWDAWSNHHPAAHTCLAGPWDGWSNHHPAAHTCMDCASIRSRPLPPSQPAAGEEAEGLLCVHLQCLGGHALALRRDLCIHQGAWLRGGREAGGGCRTRPLRPWPGPRVLRPCVRGQAPGSSAPASAARPQGPPPLHPWPGPRVLRPCTRGQAPGSSAPGSQAGHLGAGPAGRGTLHPSDAWPPTLYCRPSCPCLPSAWRPR